MTAGLQRPGTSGHATSAESEELRLLDAGVRDERVRHDRTSITIRKKEILLRDRDVRRFLGANPETCARFSEMVENQILTPPGSKFEELRHLIDETLNRARPVAGQGPPGRYGAPGPSGSSGH